MVESDSTENESAVYSILSGDMSRATTVCGPQKMLVRRRLSSANSLYDVSSTLYRRQPVLASATSSSMRVDTEDPHYSKRLRLSVYPPVKWEGIMDAVNRLPVDVAER